MIKPKSISGFPEWTPAQTLAEQKILRTVARTYELYGYTPLDTPSVERVEVLTAKGIVDKEIYALERLREESRKDGPPELGLRFDLTVPLARYVAQHYGQLSFPFKRYQIAKVWRGERPQEGRFREFYQADIDVLAEDHLPLHFDAEMPRVVLDIFEQLGLTAQVRLNNRKLLLQLYREAGVPEELLGDVLKEADKLEKIGPDELRRLLTELGLPATVSEVCLELADCRGGLTEIRQRLEALGLAPALESEGFLELAEVAEALADLDPDRWTIDLGIVRGLDYYTGTIFETALQSHPELGSICSGGRYDDLASGFIKRKLPGVGISIGVSRLVWALLASETLTVTRHCPTEVLVVLPDETSRPSCLEIAARLRSAGIPTEVFHQAQNLKKQLRYADRKGIPRVLFPHRYEPSEGRIEVKTLSTGEQQDTTLKEWLAHSSKASLA